MVSLDWSMPVEHSPHHKLDWYDQSSWPYPAGAGDQLFLQCAGRSNLSRLKEFPPLLEIQEPGVIYVLTTMAHRTNGCTSGFPRSDSRRAAKNGGSSTRSAPVQPAHSSQGSAVGPTTSENDQTATISTRCSSALKSSGLRVYSGSPAALAVAAMRRSTARAPRALRPTAVTAAYTSP